MNVKIYSINLEYCHSGNSDTCELHLRDCEAKPNALKLCLWEPRIRFSHAWIILFHLDCVTGTILNFL